MTSSNSIPQNTVTPEQSIDNMIGRHFGRWTVVGFWDVFGGEKRWICQCDCGERVGIYENLLLSAKIESCICSKYHKPIKRTKITPRKVYAVWHNMIRRCENPKARNYKNYGGRGIKVCKRWRNLKNFYEDMGECPEGMSIDRIDNDGDYSPANCRWATKKEQSNNTRRNHNIEYAGITMTLAQWSEELGISRAALESRFRSGWSVERTFSEPIHRKHD